MSTSTEMYLATIKLLKRGDEMVPISLLANELSVSPVSANEMCRKLVERGEVEYQPYKGVALTKKGEKLARQVLCRRRLWEVFLVERLGFEMREAGEMACELEHSTPEELTERLAAFLDYPVLSPGNEPIPCRYCGGDEYSALPLSSLHAGQRTQVVSIVAEGAVKDFLRSQGMSQGAALEVLSVAEDGTLLVEVSEQYLSLSQSLAAYVDVAQPTGESYAEAGDEQPKEELQVTRITLDALKKGEQGVIVRVGGARLLRRRLLDMGLVTGETITMKGTAPLGDPIEFVVKGYMLSLRKHEAKEVMVEVMCRRDS